MCAQSWAENKKEFIEYARRQAQTAHLPNCSRKGKTSESFSKSTGSDCLCYREHWPHSVPDPRIEKRIYDGYRVSSDSVCSTLNHTDAAKLACESDALDCQLRPALTKLTNSVRTQGWQIQREADQRETDFYEVRNHRGVWRECGRLHRAKQPRIRRSEETL